MNLVISKCVTAFKISNFSGHYLRNRSTLDIGVLGYIGIVQHKEHPPEVLYIPPGTPYIYTHTHICEFVGKIINNKMHSMNVIVIIIRRIIDKFPFTFASLRAGVKQNVCGLRWRTQL